MDTYYLSAARLEELKKELEDLKGEGRRQVAERLRRAKEYGDLSENSEYSEAKEEQAQVERRIIELEDMVKKVVLIGEEGKAEGGLVVVGSVVSGRTAQGEFRYHIVGSNEASPEEGKISNESPLGAAFLGKHAGDKVKVLTPRGEIVYHIEGVK